MTDDNVVKGGEKVANAPNQGATRGSLKRFSEKIEQLVFVVSTENELRPVFQGPRVLTVKQRLQFFDALDIDDGRTMDAPEFFWIELRFHRAQCLPHHRLG